MIDWKRQDKVVMRNFAESVDHHDICKIILMRLIRRKHPDKKNVAIYSEFPEGKAVADVWVRHRRGKDKGSIYVYELQKKYSDKWLKAKMKIHEDVNFIPIELNTIPRDSISAIKKALSEYVF